MSMLKPLDFRTNFLNFNSNPPTSVPPSRSLQKLCLNKTLHEFHISLVWCFRSLSSSVPPTALQPKPVPTCNSARLTTSVAPLTLPLLRQLWTLNIILNQRRMVMNRTTIDTTSDRLETNTREPLLFYAVSPL